MVGLQWHLTSAVTHTVGGSKGWDVGIDYTSWAAGLTFKVGDVLFSPYVQGQHNVVVVNKAGYDACSDANALNSTISAGNTSITFTTTGAHYYLCSIIGHCVAGMKLAVNVIAVSPTASPLATPSKAPSSSPINAPSSTPASTSTPSSAPAPSSPVPAPTAELPASAPTPCSPTLAPNVGPPPSGPSTPGSTPSTPAGTPPTSSPPPPKSAYSLLASTASMCPFSPCGPL